MNRKTFRYFVPLVLIFGLIFAAVVSADFENVPTVSNSICVAVEGSRPDNTDPAGPNIEPVNWELRTIDTTDVRYDDSNGGSKQAVYDQANSRACFEVIGIPNETYDLYIKGDDTVSVLIEDYVYLASGETADYSATVTLPEGDISGDDDVTGSDATLLTGNWEGSGDPGDLNEDGSVVGSDATLLTGNWRINSPSQSVHYPSGTRGATNISLISSQQMVRVGDPFDVYVNVSDLDAEIRSVQVDIYWDTSALALDPFNGIDSADFKFLTAANCSLANNATTCGINNPQIKVGPALDENAGTVEYFASESPGELANFTFAVFRFTALKDINFDDNSRATYVGFNPGDPGTETGTLYYAPDAIPQTFGNLQDATTVGLSQLGTQQTAVTTIIAIIAILGVATLTMTRTARRQD